MPKWLITSIRTINRS